jgi:hypothetical protein
MRKNICSLPKMKLSNMDAKVANLYLKIMPTTYGYSPRKETSAITTEKKKLSNRFLQTSIIPNPFSAR